jgi:phosphoribosylamine--glycine ligase
MPRLNTDLVPILLAAVDGHLDRIKLDWSRAAAACVVLASGGYPEAFESGKPIQGLEEAQAETGVVIFHAATKMDGGSLVTSGGRVLNIVGLGVDLTRAVERAYAAAGKIRFEGMHYRRDVGKEALAILRERAGK